MNGKNLKYFALGAAVVAAGLGALAVNIPNSFSAGQVISAAALNANFAALKAAVDVLEASRVVGFRIPAVSNVGNCTDINNPATNNKPNAVLSVSFARNGAGVVRPVGPFYNTSSNRWLVCTNDNNAQIADVEYHILVYTP